MGALGEVGQVDEVDSLSVSLLLLHSIQERTPYKVRIRRRYIHIITCRLANEIDRFDHQDFHILDDVIVHDVGMSSAEEFADVHIVSSDEGLLGFKILGENIHDVQHSVITEEVVQFCTIHFIDRFNQSTDISQGPFHMVIHLSRR